MPFSVFFVSQKRICRGEAARVSALVRAESASGIRRSPSVPSMASPRRSIVPRLYVPGAGSVCRGRSKESVYRSPAAGYSTSRPQCGSLR